MKFVGKLAGWCKCHSMTDYANVYVNLKNLNECFGTL